jgi:hypothetical protein
VSKHHKRSGTKSRYDRLAVWCFLFGSYKNSGHCYWCEKKISFRNSTFDHVPPLSKGGKLKSGVIACYSCNHKRRNKYNGESIPQYFEAMHHKARQHAREELKIQEAWILMLGKESANG